MQTLSESTDKHKEKVCLLVHLSLFSITALLKNYAETVDIFPDSTNYWKQDIFLLKGL